MNKLKKLEEIKQCMDANNGYCMGISCFDCCVFNECYYLMDDNAERYRRKKRELVERELAKIYTEIILLGDGNDS